MSTAHTALDVTGVTYRQLDYWTRQGYLKPGPRSVFATSGTRRTWSDRELTIAALMKSLTDAGIDVAQACQVARSAVGCWEPGDEFTVPLVEGIRITATVPDIHAGARV